MLTNSSITFKQNRGKGKTLMTNRWVRINNQTWKVFGAKKLSFLPSGEFFHTIKYSHILTRSSNDSIMIFIFLLSDKGKPIQPFNLHHLTYSNDQNNYPNTRNSSKLVLTKIKFWIRSPSLFTTSNLTFPIMKHWFFFSSHFLFVCKCVVLFSSPIRY